MLKRNSRSRLDERIREDDPKANGRRFIAHIHERFQGETMTTSANVRSLLLGASLLTLAAAPGLALAQVKPAATAEAAANVAEVETLIVTAAKRSEDLQDIPMSVSALSGADLQRAGIANFSDVARLLPSVQLSSSNNNRNTTILVRGIGSSGTNPGIEPSVGIFLDGVYMPAAGPIQSNIQDIASVEVLRGPQGTLYGRNTPVGAINIVTRDPQATPEFGVTVGTGNFDEYHVQGYVGGAIAENLDGRLTAWINSHDGYEKDLFDGSRTNDGKQEGVRGRAKWTPSDTVTVNLIGYYSHLQAHCCTGEPINPLGPGGIELIGDAVEVIRQANRALVTGQTVKGPMRDHAATFLALAAKAAPARIRWIKREQNLAGIALAARHPR